MKQKGFTLIELLVVVAIISLLSSIVLSSLNSARGKARDAKRIAERNQVRTALNAYYAANGVWPPTVGGNWVCLAPSSENCWSANYTGSDTLVGILQPYLPVLPVNSADTGTYAYNRLLYASNIPVGSGPLGAYLIWVQEQNMPASKCPSALPPQPYDKYWYCYEYIGPP